MFKLLLLILTTASITWAQAPIIRPALRSYQPINEIRKILYQIPAINAERAVSGLDPVINLSIGQPHRAMQMKVLDPFIAYLESLKFLTPDQLSLEMGYGHSAGTQETREWISRFYTHCFPEVEGGFSPNEVMVTNGATGGLNNLLKILIEKGDEAAVFAPYFIAYRNHVESCDGTLIPIPLVLDRPREEILDEYLASHPKIKVFLWNDPCNPTGTKSTKAELKALTAVLKKYPNIMIVHDEVYRDMSHDGKALSLINIAPELKERSFILRSLAKDILGAPGIRAGMISSPTHMQTKSGARVDCIELMSNIQLIEITSVSVLVQKMLCVALEQNMSEVAVAWEKDTCHEYAENTALVASSFKKMGLSPLQIPRGAFYVMIDVSPLLGTKIPAHLRAGDQIQNDLDAALFFLKAAGVAMVPGSGFGTEHCSLRISCARSREQLLEAISRIHHSLQEINAQ
jgi:aspartate aminotransferase